MMMTPGASASLTKIQDSLDRQIQHQPKHVVFCRRCVVSNQRPRIVIDEEGICSACRFAEEKKQIIDWSSRSRQLEELCARHRRTDGRFDVVVPGSGGKDSASVAHKLRDWYGMHPLTVTWAPFQYTDIGIANHQAFVQSGFTNLLAWPNGRVHRKLARLAFDAVGDNFVPFVFGQMAHAFHIALMFDIKLVFYGENGEAEYGGSTKNNARPYMPLEDWAEMYFKGVTIDDLVAWGLERELLSRDDFEGADLMFYRPPSVEQLQDKNIQMHWFSYYHKWVPQENYYYSTEHTGFQANPEGRSEGTYSKYASLDDRHDGIHYYMAYIKFGLGRATSDTAHEVRDGHLTREEAVSLVHRYDGEFPQRHFRDFLQYTGLTEDEFHQIVDKYRPDHLWERNGGGWQLKHRVS